MNNIIINFLCKNDIIINFLHNKKVDNLKLYKKNSYNYIKFMNHKKRFYIKYRNSYVYDNLIFIEINRSNTFIFEKENVCKIIENILNDNLYQIEKNFYFYNTSNSFDELNDRLETIDKFDYIIIESKNKELADKTGFIIPYRCNAFINKSRKFFLTNTSYDVNGIKDNADIIFKDINYSIVTLDNNFHRGNINIKYLWIRYQFNDNQIEYAEDLYYDMIQKIDEYRL